MKVWDLMNEEERKMVLYEKATKEDANENVYDTIGFLKMRYAEAGKMLHEVEEMEKRLLKVLK